MKKYFIVGLSVVSLFSFNAFSSDPEAGESENRTTPSLADLISSAQTDLQSIQEQEFEQLVEKIGQTREVLTVLSNHEALGTSRDDVLANIPEVLPMESQRFDGIAIEQHVQLLSQRHAALLGIKGQVEQLIEILERQRLAATAINSVPEEEQREEEQFIFKQRTVIVCTKAKNVISKAKFKTRHYYAELHFEDKFSQPREGGDPVKIEEKLLETKRYKNCQRCVAEICGKIPEPLKKYFQ